MQHLLSVDDMKENYIFDLWSKAIDQKNKEEVFSILNKDQIDFLSLGQVKLNTFEINSKKFNYSDMVNKYYKNFAKIIN